VSIGLEVLHIIDGHFLAYVVQELIITRIECELVNTALKQRTR